MDKQKWLAALEIIDGARIFPRIFVLGYGLLVWDIWEWWQWLENPSTAQAAFTTSIIGLCIPLLGWYMSTGRNWSKQ